MAFVNVMIIEPNQTITETTVENSLDSFEMIVGGNVSIIDLPKGYAIICNQEGNGVINKIISNFNIEGIIIVAKINRRNREIASLEETDVNILTKCFKNRRVKLKKIYSIAG